MPVPCTPWRRWDCYTRIRLYAAGAKNTGNSPNRRVVGLQMSGFLRFCKNNLNCEWATRRLDLLAWGGGGIGSRSSLVLGKFGPNRAHLHETQPRRAGFAARAAEIRAAGVRVVHVRLRPARRRLGGGGTALSMITTTLFVSIWGKKTKLRAPARDTAKASRGELSLLLARP